MNIIYTDQSVPDYACELCNNSYGIVYETKYKLPTFNAHKNHLITAQISSQNISIRIPCNINKCNHRICNFCLNSSISNSECLYGLVCPVCYDQKAQINNKNLSSYSIDLELLGNTFLNANENSQFTQLCFDLNVKNMFHNNFLNADKIKNDLHRFMMPCSFCAIDSNNNNLIKNELNKHIKTDNFVQTYCYNCMSAFCEACFKKRHSIDINFALHNPIPIQNIVISDLPCNKHRNTLKYFCKNENRFVCSDCIIKSSHSSPNYVEIYTKQERIELLDQYKKEFHKAENLLKSALIKLRFELEGLESPVNQDKTDEEIIRNKRNDLKRQLKVQECELEQSVSIISYILKELDFYCNNLNNILISYPNSLENVLDEYLKLVSSDYFPLKPKQDIYNISQNSAFDQADIAPQSINRPVLKSNMSLPPLSSKSQQICDDSKNHNMSTSSMISNINRQSNTNNNNNNNKQVLPIDDVPHENNKKNLKKPLKKSNSQSNNLKARSYGSHGSSASSNCSNYRSDKNIFQNKPHRNSVFNNQSNNYNQHNRHNNNHSKINNSNNRNRFEDYLNESQAFDPNDLKYSNKGQVIEIMRLRSPVNDKDFTDYCETEYYESECDLSNNEIKNFQNNRFDDEIINVMPITAANVNLEPGCKEEVKIVSIDDMSNIWIRLKSDSNNINMLSSRLNEWCSQNIKENSFTSEDTEQLSIGDKVGFLIENLGIWSRGVITELPKKNSEKEEKIFKLFLCDWGIQVSTVISKMKKLKNSLIITRPLSFKCYMHNLKPYSNDDTNDEIDYESLTNEQLKAKKETYSWSVRDRSFLFKWCLDEMFTMHVLSKIDDYLGIDLVDNFGERLKKEHSTASIAYLYGIESAYLSDILLKCKIASFEKKVQGHPIFTNYAEELVKYPKFVCMKPLYNEEVLIAGVSNFATLSEFFMRRLYTDNETDKTFRHLISRMQSEYNAEDSDLLQVYEPIVGMPVAAKFTLDRKWHRAEIVKVHPNDLLVDVVFVDYGNIEPTSLFNLRYLKKEFFVDDVLVFKCRLFGINYNDTQCLDQASNFFYDTTQSICFNNEKSTQIHVKNIFPEQNPTSTIKYLHEIIIRYPIDGKLTNLNVLFTKRGLATCINHSIFDGEKEIPKESKSNVIKKKPLPTKLEMEVKELSDMPNKVIKVLHDNKVLCKVTNAISPDEIWVQDVVDSNSCYDEFQNELLEKYMTIYEENNEHFKDDWQPNDLCVVKALRRSHFFRAKIIQKLPNQNFKVLYLDIGNYESNVEPNRILDLIDEYKEKPEFKAKKCFVIGIQPAGTTNSEWSSLAKDLTAQTLNDSFVYVEFKSEKRSDDSYETCIFIDTKKNSSAFDLSKDCAAEHKEYVRFADILNMRGLAFLTEKKQPIEMLLANKKAIKSGYQLTPADLYSSYPEKSVLPISINKNYLDSETFYDVVVSHIDPNSNQIYLHFMKESCSLLAEMQEEFTKIYSTSKPKMNDNKKFSSTFLKELMNRNQSQPDLADKRLKYQTQKKLIKRSYYQACVCRINDRYVRCKILKERDEEENKFMYVVYAIDYGQSYIVDLEDIYRPLIKYLEVEPQAFKLELDVGLGNNLHEDFAKELETKVCSKKAKLKINSIIEDEEIILIGDLFEKNLNAWCTNYFSSTENLFNNDFVIDNCIREFKPFALPADCETKFYNIYFTWQDGDSSNFWFQLLSQSNSSEEMCQTEIELNCHKDELKFSSMQDQFIELAEAKSLTPMNIQQIEENVPCSCFFNMDTVLYRANIVSVDYIKNIALVNYVDFGNDEEVKFADIYELDDSFLDLQRYCINCKVVKIFVESDDADGQTEIEEKDLQRFIEKNSEEDCLYGFFKRNKLDEIEITLFKSKTSEAKKPFLTKEYVMEKELISIF